MPENPRSIFDMNDQIHDASKDYAHTHRREIARNHLPFKRPCEDNLH